jgi:hypothetical protein
MVLRLISVGTSEADEQRSMSFQRHSTAAHATQSKTPSLSARLHLHEPGTPKQTTRSLKQINRGPLLRNRCDRNQPRCDEHHDSLGEALSSESASLDSQGDFCHYWTVPKGRVPCRVIYECENGRLALMAKAGSRMDVALKENLRYAGDGERSGERRRPRSTPNRRPRTRP